MAALLGRWADGSVGAGWVLPTEPVMVGYVLAVGVGGAAQGWVVGDSSIQFLVVTS